MKKNLIYLSLAVLAIMIADSCSKPDYAPVDYTAGLTNKTRHWVGYSTGYVLGDTLIPGDVSPVSWALYFYHPIDTNFAVQKVNSLQIGVEGAILDYASTNSTTHVELFDSTTPGSPQCFLDYWTVKDSCYMEYHHVGALNAASGKYLGTDIYLHTTN